MAKRYGYTPTAVLRILAAAWTADDKVRAGVSAYLDAATKAEPAHLARSRAAMLGDTSGARGTIHSSATPPHGDPAAGTRPRARHPLADDDSEP